jgi:PAS domain S-box-containing protein
MTMNLAAALLYWVIVALWTVVLGTVGVMYARNHKTFGTAKLLVLVILIDTLRNIVENVYFGVYWSGQFGLFSSEIISPLNNSTYVMMVKLFNLVVGCMVLGLLLLRWVPAMLRERAQTKAELAAADQYTALLTSVLDSASAPVLVIDAHTRERPVVFANAAYLQRYGKSKEQVLGKPVDLAATFKDDAKGAAAMAVAITEARAYKTVVHLHHPLDGHVTTNEITLQPIHDEHGNVVLLTAMCTDVTALHANANDNADAQSNTSQRERMMGQMAGAIAHDFNNLLTVMLGSLAAARDTLSPRSQEARAVNVGLAAAERSSRLARRLLNYSVNRPTTTEVVDVNRVIESLHLLLTRAVAGDVSVLLLPTPERVVVDVDVGSLEDALMNLVINAGHAMPKGGKVTIMTAVEASETASHVLIHVVDTGCGMPPNIQARAFERFFTTKERGQGSGLGLSLVREFAEGAGGSVALQSQVGTGTTITLRLPLVRDATAGPLRGNASSGVAAE